MAASWNCYVSNSGYGMPAIYISSAPRQARFCLRYAVTSASNAGRLPTPARL
jgi:hypothetical protein